MSVYSLDKEDRASIDSIFSNLDQLYVVEEYKEKLFEMTNKACDELTNYLQDEYVLRLEEIVLQKAKKIVEALLRGEDLERFGLKSTTDLRGNIVSYDFEKVRETIVTQFKDEIQNAEILKLREENQSLTKDLEYYRKRDRERY